jgi:ADP-heptose:LPS heptosyltransferase
VPADRTIIPGVRKIAVLRANRLGDFLLTVPALEALRAAYPEAEIVLLGKTWHRSFLAERPGPIDRVVVVPAYGGVSAEPGTAEDRVEVERFFAAMQREQFDLALQLQGGGRHSNPFILGLGAGTTVGLRAEDAPPLDRWLPYIYFQHEVVRYLEVVSLAGATAGVLEPRISLLRSDLDEAESVVPRTNRPLVALHPGAQDPRRRWPVERFAAVGDALSRAGAHIVVTGTEEERHLVEGVNRAMTAGAENLCGRLSLGGLAGLYARCALVISNDSGPLHLAVAAGTRTVGIFWSFNLVNVAPLTRERHRVAVSWRSECPGCGTDNTRERCEHETSFVADVAVDDVLEPALHLWQKAVKSAGSNGFGPCGQGS